MKLTVLMDNNTFVDQYYLAEPGLSYEIQEEGQHILFDAGYSDATLKNAEKMDLDWKKWKTIVISHGHADHTWGLIPLLQRYNEEAMKKKALPKPTLMAHPEAFASKWQDNMELGLNVTKDSLARVFRFELSATPCAITPRLFYLGQIPRTNDFENAQPFGTVAGNDGTVKDKVLDDTALAYKTDEGLVVITGCAHAGICNTIQHAKKVCREERILDVIGGFHLQQASQGVLSKTIDYLETQKIRHLYVAHCTDLAAKVALSTRLNVKEVGVGLALVY